MRERKDPSAPSKLTTTCAPLDPDRPTTWPWALLVNLYIFGDRFDTKQLRVDVIDWMMTKAEGSSEDLTFLTVTHAFDNTPASSPLRSFLVHHMAYNCVFDNRRGDIATLPIEFLVRVLEINTQRLAPKQCQQCWQSAKNKVDGLGVRRSVVLHGPEDVPPFRKERCSYHEHVTDAERVICDTAYKRRQNKELNKQETARAIPTVKRVRISV